MDFTVAETAKIFSLGDTGKIQRLLLHNHPPITAQGPGDPAAEGGYLTLNFLLHKKVYKHKLCLPMIKGTPTESTLRI